VGARETCSLDTFTSGAKRGAQELERVPLSLSLLTCECAVRGFFVVLLIFCRLENFVLHRLLLVHKQLQSGLIVYGNVNGYALENKQPLQ